MLTTCSVDDCDRSTTRQCGLCEPHYRRTLRHGDPLPRRRPSGSRAVSPCEVEGCDSPVTSLGLCRAHYARLRRHGSPTKYVRRKQGDGNIAPDGYLMVTIEGKRKRAHRVVMEQHLGRPLLPSENVHHINGDRLDNRIENLELWSTSQPSGQRVADKVRWARELLALYGQEFDDGVLEAGR